MWSPSASLGALPAVIGASLDQVPLKRGKACQHGDQQLALRCRGIAPGIGQRLELGAPLCQRVQDIQQVPGRAGQPIKASNDEQVAGLDPLQDLCQLDAVCLGA